MIPNEQARAVDVLNGNLLRNGNMLEDLMSGGVFEVECRDKDGNLKWKDTIKNLVTTLGKNVALDAYLAGAPYTVVGPFMGLISSVDYVSVPVVGDTMTSHATWKEAGTTNAPTYTAPRKTCSWSAAAAGAKALSAALPFVFTGGGTVKGCFLVYGTGAVSTIDNTSGTLYSAGLFTGGDKTVVATDTLNVSYTASL
jgi:hypothetical protein